MKVPNKSTVILTHYGRRSGKQFTVKIWYTEIDGELWIGSLSGDRNWVKNVTATGHAKLNFGSGAIDYVFEPVTDTAGMERYRTAIRSKYPIQSRIIALMVRSGRPVVFRGRMKKD